MKNLFYAFRYLVKSRWGNLTRLLSLSLGLLVGLYCITYAVYELTFDRFLPDRERIYQLWMNYDMEGERGNSPMLNAPLAPALAEEMPQIESATRLPWPFEGYSFYYENKEFPAVFILADTSFFRTLDFGLLQGTSASLADENSILVSESYARRIFGAEDPIGKTLMFKNKFPRTITGIYRDVPGNCSLGRFDVICSWERIKDTGMGTGWDGGDSFMTFVKLRAGATTEEVESQIPAFLERHGLTEQFEQWDMSCFFVPLDKVRNRMTGIKEVMVIVALLGFMTLFVAAMNYVLISLSLLVRRSRTLAMLRCNGARRADVFRMFLYETMCIVIGATALAFLSALCLSNEIRSATSVEIWELFTWQRIWVPLTVITAAFLLTALIPASIFSSVKLTTAFRGSVERNRRWKRILLFVQLVSVSFIVAFLIIVVLQFRRLDRQEFGYEHDKLVFTSLVGTDSDFAKYKEELGRMPQVEGCALSYELPCWGYGGMPCIDENTGELLFSARYGRIDRDFIPVMGMRLVAGENFSDKSPDNGVIVNETYVKKRGWKDNPLGRIISDGREKDMIIIGVLADFNMYQYQAFPEPLVLHPIRMDDEYYYGGSRLLIQLRDLTTEAIEEVRAKLEEIYSLEPFKINIYDDYLYADLRQEITFRNLVLILSAIILFIALIGLVGYLSDEVDRRRREVAIRKVNGARARDIVAVLSGSITWITLFAVLVGLSVAYWYGGVWIEQYRHCIDLSWWIFAVAAVIVTVIVWVTVVLKTYGIANSDPARMIKTE